MFAVWRAVHPRLKRPVGKRLAYAAAKLLKGQQQELIQGALTGPTLAGCSYGSGSAGEASSAATGGVGSKQLTLVFNKSLLGGEGLTLRPFDANETGSWLDSRGNGLKDSNGAMVCTVDPSCKPAPNQPCGNASKSSTTESHGYASCPARIIVGLGCHLTAVDWLRSDVPMPIVEFYQVWLLWGGPQPPRLPGNRLL